MSSTKEVPVYRAITAKVKYVDNSRIHEGISVDELNQRGILCNNFSFAQAAQSNYYNTVDRMVPGLPVFLNFDEAVF